MPSWPALLLVPTLALADLALIYAAASPLCAMGHALLLQVASAAALLVSIVLTVNAWRRWQRDPSPFETEAAPARECFLPLVSTAVGIFFCLLLAGFIAAPWLLPACTE